MDPIWRNFFLIRGIKFMELLEGPALSIEAALILSEKCVIGKENAFFSDMETCWTARLFAVF